MNYACLLVTVLTLHGIVCPAIPLATEAPMKFDDQEHHTPNETIEKDPILDLEYHKYLKEIVSILETDENFKKQIENASVEDIKSGKIANHLQIVNRNVRTKLDELKRKEIERLRNLITRRMKMHNMGPEQVEKLLPRHVDHSNIETFEVNDLEKLIKQATNDLEEVDKLRRDEFKEHEIEKEYERRESLEKLSPEKRQEQENLHRKLEEQRKNHERVNHPGSKDQLKEVWEEEDHLDADKFNPKTFFQLHDLDGNQVLDEYEIEALFQIELDKIFNATDPEYDPLEREEEANRMREHVFTEIDKNGDRMISLEEFIKATEEKNFDKNEEWKDVEDEPQFNDQEFEVYSKAHMPPTQPMPSTQPHSPPPQAQHHQ